MLPYKLLVSTFVSSHVAMCMSLSNFMVVGMALSMQVDNLYNSYASGHIPIIVVKLNYSFSIKLVVVNLNFASSSKLHKLEPTWI